MQGKGKVLMCVDRAMRPPLGRSWDVAAGSSTTLGVVRGTLIPLAPFRCASALVDDWRFQPRQMGIREIGSTQYPYTLPTVVRYLLWCALSVTTPLKGER